MRIRQSVIFLMFLILGFSAASAQSTPAAGTWDATLTSPEGTYNILLIVKQDGEKLTGVTKGPAGELPIAGTSKGKDITIKFTIKYQENDMLITLTGEMDGDSIKGSADYGGLGDGAFNATREKAAGNTGGAAPTSDKTDISGDWAFQVESTAGAGTPAFSFKQDGEKLTGQYIGAFGEAPLTGTVKDNMVDFVIKAQVQGKAVTITYTGTVEKDGTMKGSVGMGDSGSGTWTAKRK